MALAQYSDVFWFPTGALAASVDVQVFPKDSNSFAVLWQDSAGTIPKANPTTTDASGVLTFWAEVGQYWIHLDSESFLVDVGMSQEDSDLSTGISTGGNLTINGGNPLAIDIAPLIGYIVDNTETDPGSTTVTRIDYPGSTTTLDGAGQVRQITWWLLDSTETVIQQASVPTATQRRTHLVLGRSVLDVGAGTILEVQALPTILSQPAPQFADLLESLGPFSVSGNVISANGANLQINKSSGTLFARSFGGALTDSPHLVTSPALAPVTFRRILRTATDLTGAAVTTIDPANYDSGGSLTAVPGASTVSTVQRVYLFPNSTASLRVAVQYGQAAYANHAEAVAAIGAENFTPAPVTSSGALIGYIVVTRSAGALNDLSQATFVPATR